MTYTYLKKHSTFSLQAESRWLRPQSEIVRFYFLLNKVAIDIEDGGNLHLAGCIRDEMWLVREAMSPEEQDWTDNAGDV